MIVSCETKRELSQKIRDILNKHTNVHDCEFYSKDQKSHYLRSIYRDLCNVVAEAYDEGYKDGNNLGWQDAWDEYITKSGENV